MSPGSANSGKVAGSVGDNLADIGRSTANLANSGSQQYQAGAKEPTPSIASDISNPYAAQELQQRLQQLQKYTPERTEYKTALSGSASDVLCVPVVGPGLDTSHWVRSS